MRIRQKFTILALAAINALPGWSQPVIKSEDIRPKSGDTFLYNRAAFKLENEEGADMVWDFTSLEYTEYFIEMSVLHDVDGIGHDSLKSEVLFLHDEWYGRSWGIICSEDSLTALYQTSDPRIDDTTFVYSNPLKLFEFPLTYSATYSDQSYIQDRYNVDVTTDFRTSVTGYGTLRLPNLTIENVLQLKTVGEISELWMNEDRQSYFEKFTTPQTVYSYLAEGYPFPIVRAEQYQGAFDASVLVSKLPDHAEKIIGRSVYLLEDSVSTSIKDDILVAALYDLNMTELVEWKKKDFVINKYKNHSMKNIALENGFYIFITKTSDRISYSIVWY